jgi:ubiquinone/menaquinone biosynthesis C-methylase UbiE
MEKNKTLTQYLDLHEYPKVFYRYPILVRCIYVINFILTLRNWYVYRILRKLEKEQKEGFSFLDAGCGMGEFAIGVARRQRKSHVIGVDFTITNAPLANRLAQSLNLKNVNFLQADLTTFFTEEKYDLILCNSTLQFIQEDENALQRLSAAMDQYAVIILYVPVHYRRYFPWSESWEKKYLSDFFYKYHIEFLMHKYTDDDIRKKLNNHGFTICTLQYAYGTCGAIAFELYSMLLVVMKQLPFSLAILLIVVYACLVFPIQLFLMLCDFLGSNRTGNGLLIVAKKAKTVNME